MAYKITAAVILAIILVLSGAAIGWAGSQRAVLIPSPEDVRFELISNEPVSLSDSRSVVAGWYAMMFKDRRTGQCYVAFTQGNAMAMSPVGCP